MHGLSHLLDRAEVIYQSALVALNIPTVTYVINMKGYVVRRVSSYESCQFSIATHLKSQKVGN